MITIQRTVTTDRPLGQVYDYLSDFSNAEEWDAGTVRCERMSGDGGVGTSYRNVSRFLGRETELTYVVKEVSPRSRFVIQGDNKSVRSLDTLTMRSQVDGTEVVYRADFEFKGAAKYVEPVMRFPLKKLGDNAEQSLQRALNSL